VPDGQALDTITFAERGGLTTLMLLIEHVSRAARDAHLASGRDTAGTTHSTSSTN
jgi:hypothetical protein